MKKGTIRSLSTSIFIGVNDIKNGHATCSSDIHARYGGPDACVKRMLFCLRPQTVRAFFSMSAYSTGTQLDCDWCDKSGTAALAFLADAVSAGGVGG
jgi:hypothetical protein